MFCLVYSSCYFSFLLKTLHCIFYFLTVKLKKSYYVNSCLKWRKTLNAFKQFKKTIICRKPNRDKTKWSGLFSFKRMYTYKINISRIKFPLCCFVVVCIFIKIQMWFYTYSILKSHLKYNPMSIRWNVNKLNNYIIS